MPLGLIAFLAAMTVLMVFAAIFAPVNTTGQHEGAPGRPGSGSNGPFDKWVRPALRNFMSFTPRSVTENAARNEGTVAILARSGNPWRISPEEYAVLRLFAPLIGAVLLFVASITGYLSMLPPPVAAALGLLIGYLLPQQLLQAKWNARKSESRRTLPEALDLMRICMNAGYNFPNALAQTVDLLPAGVTKEELGRVSAEIRAGISVHDALRSLARRLPTEGVDAFTQAVEQAQITGSDIASTLAYQSSESRADYERVIEEKAQKLQTTLFFPIIGFFLPVLGILLFGPSMTQLGSAFG